MKIALLEKFLLRFSLLLFFIVVALGGVLFFLKVRPFSIHSNQPAKAVSSTPSSRLNISIPLNIHHPNVIHPAMFYTIIGPIKSISSSSIEIYSRGDPLPVFPISQSTPVVQYSLNNAPQQSSFDQLKKFTNVVLTALYDYTDNRWKITQIGISGVETQQSTQEGK